MKTNLHPVPAMAIEAFADLHGLTMEVRERRLPVGDPDRYYASFDKSDLKDGPILAGVFGNGATPEAAIYSYANRIELQTLVVDAWGPSRREIAVPRLTNL